MLAQLARSLATILAPLERALADPKRLELLLASAGWRPEQPLGDEAVAAAGRVLGVGDDLHTLLSLGDGTPSAVEAASAVAAGSRVLARLVALAGSDPSHADADLAALAAALPAPLDDPEAVVSAIGDVEAMLLSLWLGTTLPPVRTFLRVVGVSSGSSPERITWPDLLRLFSEPKSLLADNTGWGEALSLDALDRAARALGDLAPRPLAPEPVASAIAARHWGGAGAPAGVGQYGLTLLQAADGLSGDIGLVLVPVPDGPHADPTPTGLLLAPVASAGAAVPIALGDTWSATVTASADLDGAFGLVARPSADGGMMVSAEAGAPALDVELALAAPTARWTLGDAGGPQLTLAGLTVAAGIRDGPEPYVTLTAVDGVVLTLVPPDGNGFLRSLLGPAAEVTFAISVDLSTGGVRLAGGVGLGATVVLDRDLGPLHLDLLEVEVAPSDEELQLALRLAAALAIGPVLIAEQGLGTALVARPTADGSGTLGDVDLALTLLEPTLLAVTIDSDAVTGGGFVERDPDTGRYAGGLALDVFGFGIGAIAVVDTQLPGNPDGWALFASLGLTFPEPIPLGFGFTLIGVGGLLALHRTADPDALASGLKSGAADAVLLPDDIEADADVVLAGLDTWFPLKEGSTTVGPVVELGWGSPTVVSAQLGVMIVVPDLTITVLGSAALLLPTPDEALLSLRMDVLGAVDLPAGTVTVAASLHDSNLLGVFELSGDMGFYAALTAAPQFVLAIGGYSPDFHPPGALPSWLVDLRRMRASLALGEGVQATLTAYVAVTSNTVQFGGSLKLVASTEVLLTTYTAEGTFRVNVLLTLTPFRIVASERAGVTISSGDQELLGVELRARVEGPQPWYASGRASFDFFGFDVDFGFEVGDHLGGEPRARHDVGADVRAAMQDSGAWSAFDLDDAWGAGVTLARELPTGLWVRPDQRIAVRQSVAPLNREITRFGECLPTTDSVDAGKVALDGSVVTEPEWLTDWFAPAQFDELDDTSRLAAPSYELMTAGVRFGDDGVGVPTGLATECTSVTLAPEQSIWPDDTTASSPVAGPTGIAPVRRAVRSVDGPQLSVAPTEYVLVRELDGRVVATPGPYSAAVATRGHAQRVAPHYAASDRGAA